MKSTFLEAKKPLTKFFYQDDNNKLQEESYPLVFKLKSHTEEFETLSQLEALITQHAALGNAYITSNPSRPVIWESRAGLFNSDTETSVEIHDLDGLSGINTVEQYIQALPTCYHDLSYIVQYSASMGIKPDKGLSAHLFFLRATPISYENLKQKLYSFNFLPGISDSLSLNKPQNGLRWACDVTMAETSRIIYIAPPEVHETVTDSFSGNRIQHIQKQQDLLEDDYAPEGSWRTHALKHINRLRKDAGLSPKQSAKYEARGSTVIQRVAATDQCAVTSHKEERGYIYLNLSGGDSWGYYHRPDSPEILYNFKNEPNYLIKELDPEYYVLAKTRAAEIKRERIQDKNNDNGFLYTVFVDDRTEEFYKVRYNPETHECHHNTGKSKWHADNFLQFHGQTVPDVYEPWDVSFDPTVTHRLDANARHFNTFNITPSLFTPAPSAKLPPLTERVMRHALGNDKATFNHFINWLAYIFQTRCKTGKSWVLHGTQGTGKGLLYSRIIQPVFGLKHAIRSSLPRIASESYNAELEQAVFCLFDEVDAVSLAKKQIDDKLKELITEDRISIRRMRTDSYTVNSYTNYLFFSNKKHALDIPNNDRRNNIAVRQNTPLEITMEEVDQLNNELTQTMGYLMHYPACRKTAESCLDNQSKDKMMLASMNNSEGFLEHIHRGDFEFLWENKPDIDHRGQDFRTNPGVAFSTYAECLAEIVEHQARGVVSRNTLHSLIAHLSNKHWDSTATAFTQYVHRNSELDLIQLKIEGKKTRGVRGIEWDISKEIETEYKEWCNEKQRTPRDTAGKVVPITRKERDNALRTNSGTDNLGNDT